MLRAMRDWVRRATVEPGLIAALCVLGAGVHWTNRALEGTVQKAEPAAQAMALPDGKAIRVLSLGFDRLVADLFWMRTVFYVGDERYAAVGYPAVDALANLVTDIDPTFTTCYVVMSGAIGVLKGDPDGAIALLEKGVKNVDYWKLHFLLGFNYFVERLEYDRAARQMELAAQKGGPPYLPLLAARLYANAGEPETALAFIQARLREETDASTREALQKRYWDLWITRDLARIDAAMAAHAQARGKASVSIQALVDAGFLDKEPRDPRGGHYRIAEGRAATDLTYERLELHHAYAPIRPQAPAQPDQGEGK